MHDTIEAQSAELAGWNRELEGRVAAQLTEIERMGRLKRFLSPQIAELVVAAGEDKLLESHRREITVAFCDLRGFTAFSETTEPEDVMRVLGEYHAALGARVHEFEGTVEHFAGDGVMILFNDPLPCPDHAARAVAMAVAMQESVGALAQDWRKRGYELGFGVGIAQGYATLGRIGFEGRFDYAAIGSVVNLASRLSDEAKDGEIVISEPVRVATESMARTEPLGALTLKGLHRPVNAFNVTGLDTTGDGPVPSD
jgi:class 3 adenylate cyclase